MTTTVPTGWPAPANIEAIRSSLAALKLSERDAGIAFYTRLFQAAPGVRPMFPASIDEQAEKLFKTLKVLVSSLERLDTILPVLRDLGRKHIHYGAKPEHYPVVGAVLLETLRDALGAQFTDEVEKDWHRLFTVAAQAMIDGAEQEQLAVE